MNSHPASAGNFNDRSFKFSKSNHKTFKSKPCEFLQKICEKIGYKIISSGSLPFVLSGRTLFLRRKRKKEKKNKWPKDSFSSACAGVNGAAAVYSDEVLASALFWQERTVGQFTAAHPNCKWRFCIPSVGGNQQEKASSYFVLSPAADFAEVSHFCKGSLLCPAFPTRAEQGKDPQIPWFAVRTSTAGCGMGWGGCY